MCLICLWLRLLGFFRHISVWMNLIFRSPTLTQTNHRVPIIYLLDEVIVKQLTASPGIRFFLLSHGYEPCPLWFLFYVAVTCLSTRIFKLLTTRHCVYLTISNKTHNTIVYPLLSAVSRTILCGIGP